MSQRLNSSHVASLPESIESGTYDRNEKQVGIVHIGIGAFHRAHQAFYTDLAVDAEGGDWMIAGVSLRSPGVRDSMVPQDCLYTVTQKHSDEQDVRLIKVIKDVLVAPENPEKVVELLVSDSVKICSLTITEKGYCTNPASGALDFDHKDIQHDLKHLEHPKTMVGFVVRASQLRQQAGKSGFTLMSCDNLSHNGHVAKQAVIAFAEAVDKDVAEWIKQNIAFASTMVDRIVPATTDDDLATVQKVIGMEDQSAVVCEPFRQWVIEDQFPYGRPAWDSVGATLVSDVTPFEYLKLRTLNGVHSALAYLGYLSGYEYIHQAIADKALLSFVKHLMDIEIQPTLKVPLSIDIEDYKAKVRERFANTAIQYRTAQVAMDGSQKLPQRLLQTVLTNLENSRPSDAIALVVAAWIRYLGGEDEQGKKIPLSDPMADKLRAAYDAAEKGDSQDIVSKVLTASGLFEGEFNKHVAFKERVMFWFDMILTRGTKSTVEMFNLELVSALNRE